MKSHSFHDKKCPSSQGDTNKMINAFATIAGIVAPLNAVPQIIKIFETQSVGSVSLLTYIIVFVTQIVWLVYGVKLSLKPLVISSVIVIVSSGIILFQFILFA